MKKKLPISILYFAFSFLSWGQDSIKLDNQLSDRNSETVSYLQFNTVRDPANVGLQGRNFSLATFSTLPNDSFQEVHNSISGDGYLDKKKSFGVGLYYTLDNWSNRLYKNTLGFAFKKKVKNFHIGLGIERNVFLVDTNNVVFGDMIDPRKGIILTNYDFYDNKVNSSLNFKPSIIYNTKRLKIGVSLNHITEPSNSLTYGTSNAPMETNINASYLIRIKEKWNYIPMIQFNQSRFNKQLEIHNIVTYSGTIKSHFLDLIFTNQRSVNAQYGINFNNRLKFHGRINVPIYYASYFPLSAQAGIQYSIQPKK